MIKLEARISLWQNTLKGWDDILFDKGFVQPVERLVEVVHFGGAGVIAKNFAEHGAVALILFGRLEVNVNDRDVEGFDRSANVISQVTLQDDQNQLQGGDLLRTRGFAEGLLGGVVRVNQLDEVARTLSGVAQPNDFLHRAGE